MKKILGIGLLFLLIGCKEGLDYKSTQEVNRSASGWGFGPFEKTDSINPILNPTASLTFTDPISQRTVSWEARNVLNPFCDCKG